ncbi:MAG TPA: hypothetical protein VIT91_19035 [Chthoniobacterales bacterium]
MSTDTLDQQLLRFRADAQRWLEAVQDIEGTTAFYGIMARACEHLDHIITTAAFRALVITDAAPSDSVQSITGGKPPDKLTMGQCVQLLITLKPALSRALADRTLPDSPFPKQLVTLLQNVSRTRNDFAHRRFPRDRAKFDDRDAYIRAAIAETRDFLADGLRMTAFPFFLDLASHDQSQERA